MVTETKTIQQQLWTDFKQLSTTGKGLVLTIIASLLILVSFGIYVYLPPLPKTDISHYSVIERYLYYSSGICFFMGILLSWLGLFLITPPKRKPKVQEHEK